MIMLSEGIKIFIYLFLVGALLVKRNIFYHLFIFLALTLAIAFTLLSSNEPNWIDLPSLSLLFLINAAQMIYFWKKTKSISFLNKNEEILYKRTFRHANYKQFKKLISIGKFVQAGPGEILTEHGKPVSNLMLICEGQARVVVHGQTVAYSHPGNLIGEMSFVSKAPASATVYIVEPTLYFSWPQEILKDLLESDPDLKQVMQKILHTDSIRKHNVGSAKYELPQDSQIGN